MARTNKTISSNVADDHLGREQRLRKDSITQTASHTNKVRAKKGLPPRQIIDPVIGSGSTEDEVNSQLLDGGDLELVQNAGLIIGLRAYAAGAGAPVSEDEFVAIHRRVRRQRARYRELNGKMVEVGDSLPRPDKSRQKKTRPVPGVLKSIMVRLMPFEAELVGEAGTKRQDVEAAMDESVAEFERATGCEVITAVAHRMSVTDLHVHIQYTMVQDIEESKHMLGRRLKPWKQEASQKARESLLADGIHKPSPAQIGARKKKLIAECLLIPPPEAGREYRKIAGKRPLGDGAILGYSFRQKLNLVRAAESAGESQVADQVARRNDERWGRFTPIARQPDCELEEKYLDLWLERTWRKKIRERLPEEHRNRLLQAGVEAAKNYAAYGSSLVEETHFKRRVEELEEERKKTEASERESQQARRMAEEDRLHIAEQLEAEKRRSCSLSDELKEKLQELEGIRVERLRLRQTLQPGGDETLADAARRLVEKVGESEALESELAASEKRVHELDREIGPLRHLAEVVAKFLKAVMAKGPKLGPDLIALLQSIAELLGVKFRLSDKKKEDQQPEIN